MCVGVRLFPDLMKLLVVRIWAFGEAHVGKMIFSVACGTECLVCGESHNDHMAFYSVSAMLVLEAVFLVEVLFSGLVFGRR